MGFGMDEGIMAASGCCEKNLVSHNQQKILILESL
jgi:hypothetical protein